MHKFSAKALEIGCVPLRHKTIDNMLAIDFLWEQGRKISAIKLIIAFESCTIQEAKQFLEERHKDGNQNAH